MKVYTTYQNSRIIVITEGDDNTVSYCARVDTERGVLRYDAVAFYWGMCVYCVLHSVHNEDLPDKDITEQDFFDEPDKAMAFALEFVSTSKALTGA